jgi:hypothetical protein
MWPAVVVAGVLLLLGAVGTAKAPTAQAAPGDICSISGPYPDIGEGSTDLDGLDGLVGNGEVNGIQLQAGDYLYIIRVEDIASTTILASIDDDTGDAEIVSYGLVTSATTPGTPEMHDAPGSGVDSQEIDAALITGAGGWTQPFVDELSDDFDAPGMADGNVCGTATNDTFAFIVVECEETGNFEITAFFEDTVNDSSMTVAENCMGEPASATLTATPTTVESVPALGNISHSLLVLTVLDASGKLAHPGFLVNWTTSKCTVDALDEGEFEGQFGISALFAAYKSTDPESAAQLEDILNDHGPPDDDAVTFLNDSNPAPDKVNMRTIGAAVLHCEGAAPGVATVKAEIDDVTGADITASVDVTVVGPPAFITMTAAPTKLVCGEKATILVTVTDAINQKVSDHSQVELVTNFGGVIGGTGATLAFPGVNPVTPLSSGAAETFGGVGTAYLLTSSEHVGSYEVVAAAGGSSLGGYEVSWSWGESDGVYFGYGGTFSTPVVTSQVTVTCTAAAAPAVTAPSTGTGTISPPNTGDAGLAAPSSSNATLYVIAGAVAFVLAGLASFRYARR